MKQCPYTMHSYLTWVFLACTDFICMYPGFQIPQTHRFIESHRSIELIRMKILKWSFRVFHKSFYFVSHLIWESECTLERTQGSLSGIPNLSHIKVLFKLLCFTEHSPITPAEACKGCVTDYHSIHLSQIPSSLTVYVMVSSVSCDLTISRVSKVRKRVCNIVAF